MKWVQASDRLPNFPSDVIWRRKDIPNSVEIGINKDGEFWAKNRSFIGKNNYHLVEWLDESDNEVYCSCGREMNCLCPICDNDD